VEGCCTRRDCGRHPHGEPSSEPRVDRLALQRQNAEHALVYAVERLLFHKSVQRLQSERELAERQGPFWSKASCAKSLEVFFEGVLRAVDDAQVLPATALHSGLNQALLAAHEPLDRLHDHALATAFGELLPPSNAVGLALRAREIDDPECRPVEELPVRFAEFRKRIHVPDMITVGVHAAL